MNSVSQKAEQLQRQTRSKFEVTSLASVTCVRHSHKLSAVTSAITGPFADISKILKPPQTHRCTTRSLHDSNQLCITSDACEFSSFRYNDDHLTNVIFMRIKNLQQCTPHDPQNFTSTFAQLESHEADSARSLRSL